VLLCEKFVESLLSKSILLACVMNHSMWCRLPETGSDESGPFSFSDKVHDAVHLVMARVLAGARS